MSQLVKCDKIGEAIIRAMHSSEENTDKLCKAIYFPVSDEPIFDGGSERPTEAKYIVSSIEPTDKVCLEAGDKVNYTIRLDRPVANHPLVGMVCWNSSYIPSVDPPICKYFTIPVGEDSVSVFVTAHGNGLISGSYGYLRAHVEASSRIVDSVVGAARINYTCGEEG